MTTMPAGRPVSASFRSSVVAARQPATWPDFLPRRIIRPGLPGPVRHGDRTGRPIARVTPPGRGHPHPGTCPGLPRQLSGPDAAKCLQPAYLPGCGQLWRAAGAGRRLLPAPLGAKSMFLPFRDLRYLCFVLPEGIRSRRERHPAGFTAYRPPPRSLLVGIRPASRTCGKADPQPDGARESRMCYTSCYH